ncbi:MAG: hypothetical protein DPW21_07700 [Anaerolineae bacterium]|nr:hypothetical protein [Chloroflexi bacterium CFX1]MCQ3946568.1 hypothetical protein [Anaerolineae bacterium]RIK25321.1 MAG: hypothetical protein DCC54_10965 [Anaerolineae bacterium]
MKDFVARVGTFFILMGIGSAALFIASDASTKYTAGSVNFSLLCIAVALLLVGFLFRKTAAPPQAAERFHYIKKIQARREAARKEKIKKKNEQEKK